MAWDAELPPKPDRTLFRIEVSQIWRKGEFFFHVCPQEKELGPHEFEVIRCIEKVGTFTWVWPRTAADTPIWRLADFQEAVLWRTPEA